MATSSPSADVLKSTLRAQRDQLPQPQAIRLHRALSWMLHAEENPNDDMAFIAYWISFNACYGEDHNEPTRSERKHFRRFISTLVNLDESNALYDMLWHNYSNFVKGVVNNFYIYQPFWISQRRHDDQWKKRFQHSQQAAHKALADSDTKTLLGIVLDRLYVLRNQLIHGGATHNSRVNREQVKDSRRFMAAIMPTIVSVMLNNPEEDWGTLAYPVIEEPISPSLESA